MRNRNTNVRGASWTPEQIEAVWRKGRIVPNNDPQVFRTDACDAWMRRDQHGLMTQYGWEIDHIKPVARGGGDELANLQPLQWENNHYKGDTWPEWSCKVAS